MERTFAIIKPNAFAAGNAGKIKVVPMSEMAKRYKAGALDPQIGQVARAAE